MDPLSIVFSALADPTRRAIITRLSQGDATVGELAEPFDITAPAISRHIKVLEKARLIQRTKQAQWRRCSLNSSTLTKASQWLGVQQRIGNESFNRLEQLIDNQDATHPKQVKHKEASILFESSHSPESEDY